MAFPILNRSPLSVKFSGESNVISTPLEAGYEHRRPRHTRSRKTITIDYDLLKAADKIALLDHETSVGLATPFDYVDANSNTYTVYYITPLIYIEPYPGWWKFETITMREV